MDKVEHARVAHPDLHATRAVAIGGCDCALEGGAEQQPCGASASFLDANYVELVVTELRLEDFHLAVHGIDGVLRVTSVLLPREKGLDVRGRDVESDDGVVATLIVVRASIP
jgi:hypothetical protein